MARVLTIVIAVPFVVEGWHAPAGRRTLVNPALLHRTGRSGRHRRWVPHKTWARPADRFPRTAERRQPVRRPGRDPGPDPTPAPPQNRASRAGSTIHILPAGCMRTMFHRTGRGNGFVRPYVP